MVFDTLKCIAGMVVIWECILLLFQLPPYILPSPLTVAYALFHYSSLIFSEALPTIYETFLGLLFGVLIGSIAALLMMFFRPVKTWLFPLLIISQAIPTFAIAPLLVIWFGFGVTSKIVTTIIMLFYPVTSAFYDGLKSTPQALLDLAHTIKATPIRIFWYVRIPYALPAFASGVRIATVVAPIGAIVGEWVGASHGLGYLMLNANARMQIDLMFAALIIILVIALLLYALVNILLTKIITWG